MFIGGIRYDAAPSIIFCTRLHRAHQARLKSVATVFSQHADAVKISGIAGTRRGNEPGEGDRRGLEECEPPMTVIEFGHCRAIKESQAMQVCEGIRDFVVMPVDLTNPVHQPYLPACVLESH